MRVAIQQPEHAPWLGFFNKLCLCDLFVLLDNVQFKRRYFENRNKIKDFDGKSRWLTVPVRSKGHLDQKINSVVIDEPNRWKKKYLGGLENAYKSSPYWEDLKGIAVEIIEGSSKLLIELNERIISKVAKYFDIKTPIVRASSYQVCSFSGSDLILEICKQVNAEKYISGPDGRNYLRAGDFKSNGIEVQYHDFRHPEYEQGPGDFLSHHQFGADQFMQLGMRLLRSSDSEKTNGSGLHGR